jgi:hypothetical protein
MILMSLFIWHPSMKAIWQDRLATEAILFLIGAGLPALFLAFSTLGPWIYPKLTPRRWPDGSTLPKRLRGPASWLVGLALLGLIASFPLVLIDSWPSAQEIALCAFWSLFLWGIAIARYSEDRNPLPPPAPPRVPQPNWADAKPVHSDRWGRTALP